MKKKLKYTSLVAAGAVTLGLVGGTLAWFTSQDEVVNKFSTIGNTEDDSNGSGIEIVEDFIPEDAQNMTPGTMTNKDVQVKNMDNYDQFIKATIKIELTDSAKNDGEKQTLDIIYNKDLKYYHVEGYPEIRLEFTNYLAENKAVGTWYNKYLEDGKLNSKQLEVRLGDFYYIGKVEAGSHTNTLLDSVTLTQNAGNEYKNIKFDVIVTANGIQTTNGAAASEWNLSDDLAQLYSENQEVAKPTDDLPTLSEMR